MLFTKTRRSPVHVDESKLKFPLNMMRIVAPTMPRMIPPIFREVILSFRINEAAIKTNTGFVVMIIAALMGDVIFKPAKKVS